MEKPTYMQHLIMTTCNKPVKLKNKNDVCMQKETLTENLSMIVKQGNFLSLKELYFS